MPKRKLNPALPLPVGMCYCIWVGVFLACYFIGIPTQYAMASEILGTGAADSTSCPLVDAAEKKQWSIVSNLLRSPSVDVSQTQPDGMTALHWAVHWNQEKMVQELIQRNAPINVVNRYGLTPLALAVENGNSAISKAILHAGADAKIKLPGGQTLLMTAARSGSESLVRILLEAGIDVHAQDRTGQTALMWAAAEGNNDAMVALLSFGANANEQTKNGFTAMFFACREGHAPVAKTLLNAGVDIHATINPERSYERGPRKGMSALMFAVESAHYELAIQLVDAGADPNDQRSGLTPLHSLCWVRRTKIGDNPEGDPPPRGSGNITSLQFVKELVRRGADINRRLERGEGGKAQMRPRGSTPFLYAARTVDLPLMQVMLECGADPNLGNADDCKPILATAGIGVTAVGEEPGSVPEVIEALTYLIGLGADIHTVDKNGETPMHGAAYRNYPEVVSFLAERGASPTIWNKKNKYGWTPTMIAQGNRPGSFKPSPETIAALEEALHSSASSALQPPENR